MFVTDVCFLFLKRVDVLNLPQFFNFFSVGEEKHKSDFDGFYEKVSGVF